MNHDGKYSCLTGHITSIINEEKEMTREMNESRTYGTHLQKRELKVCWEFEGSEYDVYKKLVWWLQGGI